ncbi:hypothetical protein SLS62_001534 [Diatrype stigma]|uniref:Rhodopsin domain-containing protein n=1 Tax=Diatrype stigma TaxID=117547 RepID=A0AAN9VA24_9PEZI
MASDLVYLPVLNSVRAELIINCIVAVLVLAVVGLRILGRRLGPGLGWDDALILGATVIYGAQIAYVLSLSVIKMSMLSFFLRVFVTSFLHSAAKFIVVVAATCRLVYISSVLRNDNITVTLGTITFLLTLEPNLAILCVSIPMLRPLYAMYRKRSGGSRLEELEEGGNSKYANSKSRSGGRSHMGTTTSRNHVETNATWEMEDFYRPDVITHDTTVTGPEGESTPGDESGSEKNLTTSTSEPQNSKGAIRVETVWTMTRS